MAILELPKGLLPGVEAVLQPLVPVLFEPLFFLGWAIWQLFDPIWTRGMQRDLEKGLGEAPGALVAGVFAILFALIAVFVLGVFVIWLVSIATVVLVAWRRGDKHSEC